MLQPEAQNPGGKGHLPFSFILHFLSQNTNFSSLPFPVTFATSKHNSKNFVTLYLNYLSIIVLIQNSIAIKY